MKISSTRPRITDRVLIGGLIIVSMLITSIDHRGGEEGTLRAVRQGAQVIAAPVAAVGNWAFTPVRSASRWLSGLGVSPADLEALEAQNVSLRAQVASLEEERRENQRLTRLLEFVAREGLDTIGARIIGRQVSSWEAVLVIDRGSIDGVELGMPVLAPEGLLGHVFEVNDSSSRIRLITDQKSGVAAVLQSSRQEGVVSGSADGRLTMDFVSADTTVTAGEAVLTSGIGGMYPKGLLIGSVSEFEVRRGDLFQTITVEPLVDVHAVESVVVLMSRVVQVQEGSE